MHLKDSKHISNAMDQSLIQYIDEIN